MSGKSIPSKGGFPAGSAVKNPSAMRELQDLQFQSLDQEDPLEEGMGTHSSILAWRIPMDRGGLVGCSPRGHKESDTTELLSAAHTMKYFSSIKGNEIHMLQHG